MLYGLVVKQYELEMNSELILMTNIWGHVYFERILDTQSWEKFFKSSPAFTSDAIIYFNVDSLQNFNSVIF